MFNYSSVNFIIIG